MFAQQWNRPTMHFSEHIPTFKGCLAVLDQTFPGSVEGSSAGEGRTPSVSKLGSSPARPPTARPGPLFPRIWWVLRRQLCRRQWAHRQGLSTWGRGQTDVEPSGRARLHPWESASSHTDVFGVCPFGCVCLGLCGCDRVLSCLRPGSTTNVSGNLGGTTCGCF